MNREKWQQVKEIFNRATELAPEKQSAFVAEACASDDELRQAVDELLDSSKSEFLEKPAIETVAESFVGDQLAIGQTIRRYKIEEKLGAGGMGEVFLAEDLELKRPVALKVLHSQIAADKERIRRFVLEARAASALNHPNILTIYEIGESDGLRFIISEFVAGETLREQLNRKSLSLKESLDIIGQVAAALKAAHKAGIVHRDIKPENIMIRKDGLVKLLDFGLAKLNSSSNSNPNDSTIFHTRSGILLGTPKYMSPEQLNEKPPDARSDLFSLGVILYECITSKHPFSGNTLAGLFSEIQNADPPPPSQCNSSAPKKLDYITSRLLAKNPDSRYQSADELIVDLQKLSAGFQNEDQLSTQKIIRPTRSLSFKTLNSISILLRQPRYFILIPFLAVLFVGAGYWLSKPNPHVASKAATYWYDIGTEAMRNGAYYQASMALSKAIDADDKLALARVRLAETYFELDYRDRAKEELLRASMLVPDRLSLQQSDRLYIEAVTATVSGNARDAIEKHTQIQNLLPDQPQTYVDLGRAYERNNDIKNAIAKYEQAASLSSSYATPFLRLGILYGRQQDPRSDEAFKKAEEIYQAQGNHEGRTEVYYQRGLLKSRLNKISDAREQLTKAYDLARSTGNETQQILSLLQLSGVAVAENNVSQAQQYASDAVELAQSKGMEYVTARGIVDLGQAYLISGDYEQAEKYFRQALGFAQKHKDRRNEARAFLQLGSLLIIIGKTDEALTNIEQSLNFYKEGGYHTEKAQAQSLIGRAHRKKGEYDAALQAFKEQLELAEKLNDNAQKVDAYGGLGSVLEEQEQYPEALLQFDKEYEINKSLGDQVGISYSLVNRANLAWKMGDYTNARKLFDQTMSIADRPNSGYKGLLAEIYLLEAEMLLSQHQFTKIDEKIQKMQSLVSPSDREINMKAKRILCLKHAFSNSKNEAVRLCSEARDTAQELGNPNLLLKSLLSLAEASLESGDAQSAFNLAAQAHETFARNQQKDSDWRACLIMARASRQLNAEDKAKEYALRSSSLLDSIRESWGEEIFDSYLNRPDIKRQHNQLKNILQGGKITQNERIKENYAFRNEQL